MPKWNTISVSGYHIREAGSTALQELAFTLRDGLEYVQYGVDAGLDVDEFVPRISFFFNSHSDFFEEIAKYRAARQAVGARRCATASAPENPRSWQLRFHTQTAGVSLTAQQPYNNVVRTALQALAAVLGGTNSLHTNSLDEALALPTQGAATIALRTQQIIAHESGVTNVVDPLGGSYFVETLTREMEEGALQYLDTIDGMGGMVEAIERGYPQKEIAEASYQFQQAVERREKIIVGVNDFVQTRRAADRDSLHRRLGRATCSWRGSTSCKTTPRQRPRAPRARRAEGRRARARDNTMPLLLDCVRAYATVGEMCDALRDVWGEYEEDADDLGSDGQSQRSNEPEDPSRHRQAGARRPRSRRQGDRAGAARRRAWR